MSIQANQGGGVTIFSAGGTGGGGGGTPGGSSGQLQYNASGSFAGMSGTSWNDTTRSLTLTGATVTTSAPLFDVTQTWNAGGTTFTAIKMNVTDTASASASLLMDLQVGGSSRFSVDKSGIIQFGAAANASQLVSQNTTSIMFNAAGSNRVQLSVSVKIGSSGNYSWSSTNDANDAADLFLGRSAAASLRLGAADAATASVAAQTLGVQSVAAGNTNGAGKDFTIRGSAGTGTGAGGSIIFQVAPAGSSGTAQNAFSAALTIDSSNAITAGANATLSFPTSSTTAPSAPGIGAWVSTLGLFGTSGTLAVTISGTVFNLSSAYTLSWNSDVLLTRAAAASLRLGAADAAAPVAQTLGVQSVVAGTSNTAGANFTIKGSAGTGTGAGGSIIFQVAPAGSSGTAQNAFSTALTINSAQQVIVASNGTASLPALVFGGRGTGVNWGLFSGGTSSISVAIVGTETHTLWSDGSIYANGASAEIRLRGDTGWYSLGTNGDVRLYRDAANTLALRNGTSAQTFNVYGTYTDASNYIRGYMDMVTSSGYLAIGSVGAGTGTSNGTIINGSNASGKAIYLRPLTGNSANSWVVDAANAAFFPETDKANDIGRSSFAPRDVYFGRNLVPTATFATNQTTGFINIPGAAGAPSGVPSNTTGFPLYYDSTNNKIYVYNGSWRSTAALT